MISLAYAKEQDAAIIPSSTEFVVNIGRMVSKLPAKDRAVFITAAIRAAELCGKAEYAWHLANEFKVDPWRK